MKSGIVKQIKLVYNTNRRCCYTSYRAGRYRLGLPDYLGLTKNNRDILAFGAVIFVSEICHNNYAQHQARNKQMLYPLFFQIYVYMAHFA